MSFTERQAHLPMDLTPAIAGSVFALSMAMCMISAVWHCAKSRPPTRPTCSEDTVMPLFKSRTPLAWLNLIHEPKRLVLAIAGTGFAVMLMFMQLGFRGALFDSPCNCPGS